jgi:hypothetical protein
MAAVTRKGLYGGPRQVYGSFAGKEPAAPGPGNFISLLKEDEIIRMLDQDFTILVTPQYYTSYINETKTGSIIRVGGYGHQQS